MLLRALRIGDVRTPNLCICAAPALAIESSCRSRIRRTVMLWLCSCSPLRHLGAQRPIRSTPAAIGRPRHASTLSIRKASSQHKYCERGSQFLLRLWNAMAKLAIAECRVKRDASVGSSTAFDGQRRVMTKWRGKSFALGLFINNCAEIRMVKNLYDRSGCLVRNSAGLGGPRWSDGAANGVVVRIAVKQASRGAVKPEKFFKNGTNVPRCLPPGIEGRKCLELASLTYRRRL